MPLRSVQKPLATVVTGDLVSSTALTLLILPVLYTCSERGVPYDIKSNFSNEWVKEGFMTSSQIPGQVLTAVGLAMDCTAIAIAYGLSRPGRAAARPIGLALCFGFFQALLYGLGWTLGTGFREIVGRWDHWIAFSMLTGIAAKMVLDSYGTEPTLREWKLDWPGTIVLGIAASIDALAVGLGISLSGSGLLIPVFLVGTISVVFPLLGFHGASRFGGRMGAWAERLGGLVLAAIGMKILIEHLVHGI